MGLEAHERSDKKVGLNRDHTDDNSRREAIQRRNKAAAQDPEIFKILEAQIDLAPGSYRPCPVNTGKQAYESMTKASRMMKAALILLGDGGCILSAAKLADAVEYLDVSITKQLAAWQSS